MSFMEAKNRLGPKIEPFDIPIGHRIPLCGDPFAYDTLSSVCKLQTKGNISFFLARYTKWRLQLVSMCSKNLWSTLWKAELKSVLHFKLLRRLYRQCSMKQTPFALSHKTSHVQNHAAKVIWQAICVLNEPVTQNLLEHFWHDREHASGSIVASLVMRLF